MLNRTAVAWSALALALLVLVVVEQDRPWKRLQAEHRARELERLRAELDVERSKAAESGRRLDLEVEAARQAFEKSRETALRLEKDLRRARNAESWARAALTRLQARDAAPREELRQARQKLEERELDVSELEKELANLRSDLDEAESRRARAVERAVDLERRIAGLEKGAFLRGIPGLRGLDPTLAVVEAAPPGLVVETAAGRVRRLDRCMTCHPVASHPGPLVGDDTAHPPGRFGCTVCHGGNGRATDFSRAGHWPAANDQEAEWAARWGFSRKKLTRELILPPSLVEAGCVECHESGPPIEAARGERVSPELGRRLVRRMGCAGCHTGGPGAPRQGPPLDRLSAKTTPEWTYHWIAAPRRLRPTTWMPHLFPEDMDAARKAAIVHAMVRFLWSPSSDEESVPEGDAETGGRLFARVGCTGCHVLDAGASRDGVALERLHGPNLAGLGDKVRPGWLYAWLRDPRSHHPDTRMPNLRLSEQEAADLTAFLTADRTAGPDLSIPRVDNAVRDALVLEHLEQELPLADSAARLAEMSRDGKDLYLGLRSLETYGCHGCHEIPGFEDVSPVAGTLAETGSDPRRLLAADAVDLLAHQDSAAGPRPDYGMSRREADAVRARLLAMRGSAIDPGAPEAARLRNAETPALADGRRLLEDYGCLGCHRFDGRGGAIPSAAGEGRPPDLTLAGSRLQSSWIYDYLGDPARLARRPWLNVRMPSFSLPSEHANALVELFAAHGGEELFTSPPPSSSQRDREVGRAVMAMLQCRNCHADSPEADGRPSSELAPAYRGAAQRLRPDWVVRWILDPESLDPDTVMPVAFAGHDGASATSYLTATISAPMFIPQRQRLLSLFESEEDLLAYLADARQVTEAIRDYLWSLED